MTAPNRPFYFLRHGQTDWNVEGRLQGHTDIHLNETGHAQARAAASVFKDLPITRLISSPLQRALVTATYVAEHLGLPLEADPGLKERHYGTIEGMTRAEIDAQPPGTFHDLTRPVDWAGYRPLLCDKAESMDALADRAKAAVFSSLARHPNDTLLFVAHGTWFRALAYRLTGKAFRSDNAVPYRFTPREGPWKIELL